MMKLSVRFPVARHLHFYLLRLARLLFPISVYFHGAPDKFSISLEGSSYRESTVEVTNATCAVGVLALELNQKNHNYRISFYTQY